MKLNVPTPISQAVAAIAGVLAGLALGAAIVATIATLFLGYRVVSVNSGSMEPAIKKADIVVIRGADLAKVKENDVIFYQERNTRLSFVHRVIAVRVQDLKVQDRTTGDILSQQFVYEFVTQGDANLGPDPETVRGIEDFGGKVWFKVPTFGLFPTGISPRIMLFAVAGLFAVLWFIWEGLNRGNRSKPPSRGKKRARASARPTRSTTRAGSVDIRRLRPAKPGPLSRLGSWLIDQADDLLYGLTRLWRRVGRSIAAQRRLASRHVRVPRGAGLWVLAPLAVWAGAIAVLAGSSAFAGSGFVQPWTTLRELGGISVVRGGSPTPASGGANAQPCVPENTIPGVLVPLGGPSTPAASTPQPQSPGSSNVIVPLASPTAALPSIMDRIRDLLNPGQRPVTATPSPSVSPTATPSPLVAAPEPANTPCAPATAASEPLPSPSPAASPSPSPSATATAASSATEGTPNATPTGVATGTPQPTSTTTPGSTPSPSSTPGADPTASPSSTPGTDPTASPSSTQAPSATSSPGGGGTPGPGPASTPVP